MEIFFARVYNCHFNCLSRLFISNKTSWEA